MLRDSWLEMVVCSEDTERSGDRIVNRIKDAQAGEIKAAKGHMGSCDQIFTGFNNHTPPIQEVLITSTRTAAVAG